MAPTGPIISRKNDEAQPLLYEQLREWGIDISKEQLNRLLIEDKGLFHQEKPAI